LPPCTGVTFRRTKTTTSSAALNLSFPARHERSIYDQGLRKYAATGGWGFGHFNKDGTLGNDALMKTCFPCHAKASRDLVFTQYAP